MPLPSRNRSRPARAAVAGAFAVLCACDRGERQISEQRSVTAEPARPVTSAERFGFSGSDPASAGAAGHAEYAWQLPPGWRELPATPMRAASFAVEGAPEIDCSVTVLPGGGGGIEANLNRWRRQMSLPELGPEDRAALASLPMLGASAVVIECDGTYTGMGNEAPQAGAKLLGCAVEHAGNAVFVKMVGPAPAVQRERAHFEALCRSLRATHTHAAEGPVAGAPQEPAPAPTPNPPDAPASAAQIAWDTPAGWSQAQAGSMRLVSFVLGKDRATECYVTVLPGAAGGLAANINRWRRQMAQPDLTPDELAALPAIPMLGTHGRLVRIRGDFTGMDGASLTGAMMLGAVCEAGDQAVFVKMVGPESDVAAEEDRFAAFCGSLRR